MQNEINDLYCKKEVSNKGLYKTGKYLCQFSVIGKRKNQKIEINWQSKRHYMVIFQ